MVSPLALLVLLPVRVVVYVRLLLAMRQLVETARWCLSLLRNAGWVVEVVKRW